MSEPLHRISYKRYLTDAEEEIPPRTIRRWALKKRCVDKISPTARSINTNQNAITIFLNQPFWPGVLLFLMLMVRTS